MTNKLSQIPVALRVLWQHRRSGLFDHEWYFRANPDVRETTKRPFLHFAFRGVFEGRAPHAGFDPALYLAANPDVQAAGQHALLHYTLYGHRGKRRLRPVRNPNEVQLQAESSRLTRANRELSEENELLLLQLHQVQEELEKYFLENKSLREDGEKLARLERSQADLLIERDEVLAESDALKAKQAELEKSCVDLQAKLAALEKSTADVQGRHDLLAKAAQETEAKLSALSAERDNAVKEREQVKVQLAATLTERDNAAKEREALKKVSSERAMRIAELEALVADQSERQRQIDEEMAKAEGQLDMLKELLRPALH